MLILGSHREDYRPLNPLQIPQCSRSQQGGREVELGASNCSGDGRRWVGGELSPHPATASKHLLPALPCPISSHPTAVLVLPSCGTWGQNYPPRAPERVW